MSKATDKSASDKSPSASPCTFQSDNWVYDLQWTSCLTSHCKGGEQQCHEYFCHTVFDKHWNKEHERLVPTSVFFSQWSNISMSLITYKLQKRSAQTFSVKGHKVQSVDLKPI